MKNIQAAGDVLMRVSELNESKALSPCGGWYVTGLVFCILLMWGCQGAGERSSGEGRLETEVGAGRDVMPNVIRLPSDVRGIMSLKEINGVTVDLIEVGPWYNKMPLMVEGEGDAKIDPGRLRHLVVRAVLRNATADDLSVELMRAYVSFDAGEAGEEIAVTGDGLTLMDGMGEPTGGSTMILGGHEPKVLVRFRGYGLFEDGHANELMYVTLVLKIGAERVFIVRRAGQVVLAM